ncbi:MAG: hypothetical protein M1819_001393 [Sarea resinae]|nr:MAG: hypothetical protein M1819_001393 [Sarea resinae]
MSTTTTPATPPSLSCPSHPLPRCVATTGPRYRCTVADSARRDAAERRASAAAATGKLDDGIGEEILSTHQESNFFKNAQWTPDGTCIVTNSEDNVLRTFIVPADLLSSDRSTPHTLTPYTSIPHPEPTTTFTIHPSFSLADPRTHLLLSAPTDHPIQLHSALSLSATTTTLLASYPLVHAPTEKHITPSSLLFHPGGTHFLAGSSNQIAAFDLSRPGSGPISTMATAPSRRQNRVVGGVGLRGIVSAMAISADGLLAAGTFSNNVGLYDQSGWGECTAIFSISSSSSPGDQNSHSNDSNDEIGGSDPAGTGITALHFSPCGRYLFVSPRQSDAILVYDIRVSGRRLGYLSGRAAHSNQRLGVDVTSTFFTSETGSRERIDVWAGGADGVVRVWKDAISGFSNGDGDTANDNDINEQCKGPTWSFRASEAGDSLGGVCVHPFMGGAVVATCSGERRRGWESEEEEEVVEEETVGRDKNEDRTSDSASSSSLPSPSPSSSPSSSPSPSPSPSPSRSPNPSSGSSPKQQSTHSQPPQPPDPRHPHHQPQPQPQRRQTRHPKFDNTLQLWAF